MDVAVDPEMEIEFLPDPGNALSGPPFFFGQVPQHRGLTKVDPGLRIGWRRRKMPIGRKTDHPRFDALHPIFKMLSDVFDLFSGVDHFVMDFPQFVYDGLDEKRARAGPILQLFRPAWGGLLQRREGPNDLDTLPDGRLRFQDGSEHITAQMRERFRQITSLPIEVAICDLAQMLRFFDR